MAQIFNLLAFSEKKRKKLKLGGRVQTQNPRFQSLYNRKILFATGFLNIVITMFVQKSCWHGEPNWGFSAVISAVSGKNTTYSDIYIYL